MHSVLFVPRAGGARCRPANEQRGVETLCIR